MATGMSNACNGAEGAILREIATLAETGKVRPLIDPARSGLEQRSDTFRHLESDKALGRGVVDLM
ncbi:hypothetical protein EB235_11440 [Mesorhizobium loti R88b]|uniref:Alcohol dehydrogenase-like C-terminal domain-containing protein n=2 Tax=Rhizobium loti TaxID=381 RepID=A0A6M7WE17_RHILI|nr:hypothetical protein EB235_11440 [Mesorhizobium loti R88b]